MNKLDEPARVGWRVLVKADMVWLRSFWSAPTCSWSELKLTPEVVARVPALSLLFVQQGSSSQAHIFNLNTLL